MSRKFLQRRVVSTSANLPLARLRGALGDPLLLRAWNKMVPTALAIELRPKVRRFLAEIEQTLRAPANFNPAASERSFRIAANDYAVTAVLSPLLEHLQQKRSAFSDGNPAA